MARTVCGVLLADAHASARSGLRFFLDGIRSIEVVGEAVDDHAVLAMAAQLAPDVIVIDPFNPKMGGLPTILRIQRCFPAIHVLVLTNATEHQLVPQTVSAEAASYLFKEEVGGHELVAAIHAVCAGERVLKQRSVGDPQ